MIGYRGRYEHLGKASARLDVLANLAPARLSALLMLAAGSAPPPARTPRLARRPPRPPAHRLPERRLDLSAPTPDLLDVAVELIGDYRIGDGFRDPIWYDVGPPLGWRTPSTALAVPTALAVTAVRGLHSR